MLEAYQQYLANAEALAEQDATNTGWQQDLLILSRKRQSKLSPRKAAKPTEHLGVSELKTFSPQQRVRVGPDINIFPSYSITFPITKSTVDMKHLTVLTFIAIVLALTIASSYLDLGTLNLVVTTAISIASTTLIILFYMHVHRSKPLLWVFVGAGFFWLGIMFALALSDFLTRGWK